MKTDGQQPSTPSQQTSIEGDQQHQQFLGDATQALPDLDPIQYTSADPPLPEGLSQVSRDLDRLNTAVVALLSIDGKFTFTSLFQYRFENDIGWWVVVLKIYWLLETRDCVWLCVMRV